MNALSPWGISASAELAGNPSGIVEQHADSFNFTIIKTPDSIWIQTESPMADASLSVQLKVPELS